MSKYLVYFNDDDDDNNNNKQNSNLYSNPNANPNKTLPCR